MKRYFSLFFHFLKNNLIREMEFKENFFFWIIVQAIYVGLHILTINIYFSFTDSLSGWSKTDVYLLVGVFRLIEGFFKMFIYPNVTKISEFIVRGDLDYSLTKPISSLFILGTRYHSLDEVATVLGGVGILVYLSSTQQYLFSFSSVLGITVFSFFGIMSLYCLLMIFATFSIFATRLTSIWVYWDVISKTLRFPLDMYTNGNRIVNGIFWPFLVVVTLPSQIILGKISPYYSLLEISAPLVMFFTLAKFWNFALRHYSSASS